MTDFEHELIHLLAKFQQDVDENIKKIMDLIDKKIKEEDDTQANIGKK